DAVEVAEVRAALERGEPITLLDVREPVEVAAGAIDGAVHVPLAHVLTEGGRQPIPQDRVVIAYCKAGPRSERAAAALRAAGYEARWLVGGYPAWAATDRADAGIS